MLPKKGVAQYLAQGSPFARLYQNKVDLLTHDKALPTTLSYLEKLTQYAHSHLPQEISDFYGHIYNNMAMVVEARLYLD